MLLGSRDWVKETYSLQRLLAELASVVRRFSQPGVQDFLTLTLTEQSGRLYVGAREALFAFSVETLELQGVVRGGGMGGSGG